MPKNYIQLGWWGKFCHLNQQTTTLVQEDCSFQHLMIQYEFGYINNEKVLRVKMVISTSRVS